MRVVLMDDAVRANRRRGDGSELNFSWFHISGNIRKFEQSPGPSTVMNDEDQAKKKLICEVLRQDEGPLRITLSPKLETRTIEVKVMPTPPNGSVLGSLVQKFHGNVRISLYLKGYDQHMLDFASVEGMCICAESFACKGVATNVMEFPLRHNARVHVKLVADITFTSDIFNKVPSVKEGLPFSRRILERGTFSDVVILAGNGAEIKAHKSFLSACSPVLEAMFASEMEESQTGRVDMSDLSEEGVRAFLRYVYYEDLKEPWENIEVAHELLYAGHKYDVPSLEAQIMILLLHKTNADISVEWAFKIYMFTRNIDSAVELKMKAIQIMKAKWDELEKLEEYKELFEKPSNSRTCKELFKDFALATSP